MSHQTSINIHTGSTSHATDEPQLSQPINQHHSVYTGAATNEDPPYFDQSSHPTNYGQSPNTFAGIAENTAQNFISISDLVLTDSNEGPTLHDFHDQQQPQQSQQSQHEQQLRQSQQPQQPQQLQQLQHEQFYPQQQPQLQSHQQQHQSESSTYHNHYDEFDHYHQYFENQSQQQQCQQQPPQPAKISQQTYSSPDQPVYHSLNDLTFTHSVTTTGNYANTPTNVARSCDDISSKQVIVGQSALHVHYEPRKTIWDEVSNNVDPKIALLLALMVMLLAIISIATEDEVPFTYIQAAVSVISLGAFIKLKW